MIRDLYYQACQTIYGFLDYSNDKHPIDIFKFCLEECQKITLSKIGFFHFVNPDKETISLFTWTNSTAQECRTVEASHYSVTAAGIWADPVRDGKPVIHNNYLQMSSELKKGLPNGHIALLRELVVPIKHLGSVVAVMGVGNKDIEYTEDDLAIVENLANLAWAFYIKTKKDKKELPAIISVCSNCKKMRDENGVWHDLREYLTIHSIQISDGVCPACMNHYSNLE